MKISENQIQKNNQLTEIEENLNAQLTLNLQLSTEIRKKD